MSISNAYNFNSIDAGLSTAGLLSPEQLASLRDEGYEVVINLLPDDSEYAIPSEQQIIEQQGVEYHYIPVDFAAPEKRDYHAFEKHLGASRGRKTLVHCAANYRVSAFYAIYAHRHLGWTTEQAQSFIHNQWQPREHPPWQQFVTDMLAEQAV